LYYYLYRFYDPNLQRWPNRDPIQETGGLNLFALVKNAPTFRIDRFGLIGWSCDEARRRMNRLENESEIGDGLTQEESAELAALKQYVNDNCPPPPLPPSSSYCPIGIPAAPPVNSNNQSSFCFNHPWACGGIAVGVGTGIFCLAQPELCGAAIGFVFTLLRTAPVAAGATAF
jgi:hypothetical protein